MPLYFLELKFKKIKRPFLFQAKFLRYVERRLSERSKRSRNDDFLVVKKITIPVGFDRKCCGKCVAVWPLVRYYNPDWRTHLFFGIQISVRIPNQTKLELDAVLISIGLWWRERSVFCQGRCIMFVGAVI